MKNRSAPAGLATTTIVLLIIQTVQANLWSVSIDEAPAPLPQDGPPFSANASRNRAFLPAQICGIVGAYFASILLLGALLLTVGQRLRSNAQSSQSTLAMEMVRPSNRAFDTSPVSPASTQRSWYSPRRAKKKASVPNSLRSANSPGSPDLDSLVSFDTKVIEADKAARRHDLERLYAAVMSRDDYLEGPSQTSQIQMQDETQRTDRRPLRLLTSAPALQHLHNFAAQESPTSPVNQSSPRSPVRAIYPPDSPRARYPTSPTSPLYAEYPTTPLASQYRASSGSYTGSTAQYEAEHRFSRASSFGSQASDGSRHKNLRKGLRKIKISAPIAKYPSEEDSDSARTPLTPRYYTDPGIPPSPPKSSATPAGSRDISHHQPEMCGDSIKEKRDLPRPAPQRLGSYEYDNIPQAITDVNNAIAPRPVVTSTNRNIGVESSNVSRLASHNTALNTSSATLGVLPFRSMRTPEMAEPLQSPSRQLKTTHLERRRDLLAVNGPRTGLATPYSPYMPFTPITPVTPHLTSRRERKQREKEEGRRVLGQEDAVISEEEMWGNAY